MRLPEITDKKKFADGVTKHLEKPDLGDDVRDRTLDQRDAVPEQYKPISQRPEVINKLILWILTLRAFTVSLKNLENLPKELKLQYLDEVLEGWSTLLRYACITFHETLEKGELKIGDVVCKLVVPENVNKRFLRLMFLGIPQVVGDYIRRDLGTEKLEQELKNVPGDRHITPSFLPTTLCAELKLPEYISELEKLRKRIRGSGFFSEALLLKLQEIYVRYGVDEKERPAFRKLAGEISADIQGLKRE